MKSRYVAPWVFAFAGLMFVSMPGCSTKWLQSGGDTTEQGLVQGDRQGKVGTGSGADSFPDLSRRGDSGGGEGGPLRGFQSLAPGQTPDEERLNRGTLAAKSASSDRANRKTAELRREEAAAAAAGLKDVFFGYDSWAIEGDNQQALTHNAAWLKENPKGLLKIEGHCDERGTQAYNMVLGEKRAKATRSYLIDLGISPKQIAIISYGKEQPFCFERNEACYQQNRRGHVLLRTK